jgi:hypothetical protein
MVSVWNLTLHDIAKLTVFLRSSGKAEATAVVVGDPASYNPISNK